MKALILAPHPDDAEIAMGGTIQRMQASGTEVHVVVFTGEGALQMVHSKETVLFAQRQQEQVAALKCLGVPEVNIHWLNMAPASQFDRVQLSAGVIHLDRILSEGFQALYVPMRSHNQDHNYVFDAAMAATRPTKCDHTSVFLYEQPTQFHGEQMTNTLGGRYYISLHEQHMVKKRAAILCHQSQMKGRENSLAGVGGVDALARLRGMEIGQPYAELFYLIRSVQ